MNHNEVIEKVNELIAAPMCNPELRAKAEAYLKEQNKANADALLRSLDDNVSTIDETIAFAESEFGKEVFGEERAAEMAKHGHEFKDAGGKYCFCPVCQAGSAIYENKECL